MTKQALRNGATGNRQLDETNREASKIKGRLNAVPFVDGFLVTGLTFAAGTPLVINHGLRQRPRGFIVVRSYGANAAPPPVESASQPTNTALQIALQTTAVSTFDIWFW